MQWGGSTNSDDNGYVNVNYEDNQQQRWDRIVATLCVDLVPGLRVRACRRERSKVRPAPEGRTVLRQKEHYLSASQARPMLTTGVVRSGLASVTHDETRVKSSCFHVMFGNQQSPLCEGLRVNELVLRC